MSPLKKQVDPPKPPLHLGCAVPWVLSYLPDEEQRTWSFLQRQMHRLRFDTETIVLFLQQLCWDRAKNEIFLSV